MRALAFAGCSASSSPSTAISASTFPAPRCCVTLRWAASQCGRAASSADAPWRVIATSRVRASRPRSDVDQTRASTSGSRLRDSAVRSSSCRAASSEMRERTVARERAQQRELRDAQVPRAPSRRRRAASARAMRGAAARRCRPSRNGCRTRWRPLRAGSSFEIRAYALSCKYTHAFLGHATRRLPRNRGRKRLDI